MKLYEVYTPEIGLYVRYRVMAPDEVELLVEQNRELPKEDYMRVVLEAAIYNLKLEVTQSLKKMTKVKARAALTSLFRGCVMLNPGLDIDSWLKISNGTNTIDASDRSMIEGTPKPRSVTSKSKKLNKTKFMHLERHLKDRIAGQDEAIEEVCRALKRSVTGLNDENRPLGVFMFAGASGVGKTYLARELQSFLFGDTDIIRVDCGEYQHKHENQKILGSPPGYIGHEEGGQLTNAIMKNPQSVVLLDEVEKAHPDLWNTFLRAFDEGILTDSTGQECDFRESIIIMTTNLGNGQVVDNMLQRGFGFSKKGLNIDAATAAIPARTMVIRDTNEAIRKNFKPEFLNRIDKTVVFNHLTADTLRKIVELEFGIVEEKLARRGFTLTFDDLASEAMLREGYNPVQGARGLAQVRRDRVENALADMLLSGRYARGTNFQVTFSENFIVSAQRPSKRESATAAS